MNPHQSTSPPLSAEPPGFALLSVLLALLVFGALGAISVGLAVSEVRMARNVMEVAEAGGLVEQDITQAFESLDPGALAIMPVGSTVVDVRGGGGDSRRRVDLRRTGDDMFLIGATIDVPDGPYRSAALLVRLAVPRILLSGPVSSGGPVSPGSGTTFAVVDTEADADCGPTSWVPVLADVGAPAEDLAAWLERATVVLPAGMDRVTPGPTYSSRECYRADPGNWGDPARATTECGRYLPVVRALGDLEVDGGVGQGVLLVEGDLTLRGGAEFHGVILVGGKLTTAGLGARVIGAVQVNDPGGEGSALDGSAVFTYSPCAIGRALLPFGEPKLLAGRSWIGTY